MGGPGLDEPALLAAADSAVLREAGGACTGRWGAGSLRASEQRHRNGVVPTAGDGGRGHLFPGGPHPLLVAGRPGGRTAARAGDSVYGAAGGCLWPGGLEGWSGGAATRTAAAVGGTAGL